MSKLVNSLVEAISTELESHSPHASLDHVENEVQQLVDIVRLQKCAHCSPDTGVTSEAQPSTKYIKG